MCVSGHAQVGGAALATAIGIGSSHVAPLSLLREAPRAPHALAQQMGSELAFTGSSHTALLAIVAVLLILAGLLMVGLVRRHHGSTA